VDRALPVVPQHEVVLLAALAGEGGGRGRHRVLDLELQLLEGVRLLGWGRLEVHDFGEEEGVDVSNLLAALLLGVLVGLQFAVVQFLQLLAPPLQFVAGLRLDFIHGTQVQLVTPDYLYSYFFSWTNYDNLAEWYRILGNITFQ
jgi:hypothetical protein